MSFLRGKWKEMEMRLKLRQKYGENSEILLTRPVDVNYHQPEAKHSFPEQLNRTYPVPVYELPNNFMPEPWVKAYTISEEDRAKKALNDAIKRLTANK